MSARKKRESLYDQVTSTLNTLQGNTIPSYQGLHAFWLNPEIFLTASLYGQRLIAPADGESHADGSGCCGYGKASKPTVVKENDCCGSVSDQSANPNSNPAVTAVEEPPTTTFIGDCWPSGGAGGGGGSFTGKRSDDSAIIVGLKGLHPFDGTIFPRLLWDTDAVANSSQIALIANWIDAGCPLTIKEEDEKEKGVSAVTIRNEKLSLAHGDTTHKKSDKKSNEHQKANKDINVRKEISSLSKDEVATYREALSCMYQYNDFWQDERSYDFWARIHTNSCQHGWEQFGPWHRVYLYFFEQKLQDYNEHITIPYWSWSQYASKNKTSFNNTEYDLGVLPDRFGCFLTCEGLENLKSQKNADGKSLFSKKEIDALESIQSKGTIYNSGLRFLKAAKIPYEIVNSNGEAVWSDKIRAIYNVLRAANPLWFPNRWPGAMGPLTSYPTKKDIDVLLSLNTWSDFGGGPSYDHHFGSLEKVHNGMHNFSGGTNANYPTSPPAAPNAWNAIYNKLGIAVNPQNQENPIYGWMTDNRITAFDPLFWSHHSNVDRLWAKWQTMHSGKPEELNGVLAPWSMTVDETLSIKKLGYKYVRDYVHYKVSNDVGLVNFRSDASKVSKTTLDEHSKLEIKIHRVQRGNLASANIRVFLNTPDANVDTPVENNPNFVEQISLFHGSCYGGPRHCDLPLDKTRPFDHRKLHHHEPRNFLIDATNVAQNLLNNGAKDITVQLVVVGLHGAPIDNALYIDGVSLNFID